MEEALCEDEESGMMYTIAIELKIRYLKSPIGFQRKASR